MVVGGCAPATGVQPGKPSAPTVLPANPITVVEHLDTTKTVTASIEVAGGTVAATGADGTVYTLTVPKDALLGGEQISLTPLASLDNLPFAGGPTGAVHIEPGGLVLAQPATLTILPAKPPATPPQVGLIYEGTGSNLHLYPLSTQTGLQFQVLHFSSLVVPVATSQEVTAQMQHPPQGTLAQFEQAVARARQQQVLGLETADEVAQALGSFVAALEQETVRPEVAAADQPGATYETVRKAMEDLLVWERDAQFLGVDTPDFASLIAQVTRGFDRVFPQLIIQCVQGHDIRAGLRAFGLVRARILLGDETAPGLDKVAGCLQFELDFDMVLHLEARGGNFNGTVEDAHLKASSIPMHLFYQDGTNGNGYGGEAPLEYLSFSYTLPGCNVSSVSTPTQPFYVAGMGGLEIDYRPGHDELTDFFVGLNPGFADELGSVDCGGGSLGVTSLTSGLYEGGWFYFHSDEEVNNVGGGSPPHSGYSYAISGWNIVGGAVFASKRYQKTISVTGAFSSFSETTTFIIRHTPK